MQYDILHFYDIRPQMSKELNSYDTDRNEQEKIKNTLWATKHLLVSGSKYKSALLKSGDKSIVSLHQSIFS